MALAMLALPSVSSIVQMGCRGCRRRCWWINRVAAAKPWDKGVVPPTGNASSTRRAIRRLRVGGSTKFRLVSSKTQESDAIPALVGLHEQRKMADFVWRIRFQAAMEPLASMTNNRRQPAGGAAARCARRPHGG